jgi:hypothetical protein
MAKKLSILKPPPGYNQEDWDALPRQRRWQITRQAAGICVSCGREPIEGRSKRLGLNCQAKQRELMRQKTGASRRNTKSASYQ